MNPYFDHPNLGSTALRIAGTQSVGHMLARSPRPSDAMRFGTLVHMAVLEPERFEKGVDVSTPGQCSATTKHGDQCSRMAVQGDTLCRQHGGVSDDAEQRIPSDLYDRVCRCSDRVLEALHQCGLTDFPDGAQTEVPLYGSMTVENGDLSLHPATRTDAPPMVGVKGLIDAVLPERGLLLDLKTSSQGVSERQFRNQIRRYALHVQAALYLRLAAAEDPDRAWAWAWVAVESEEPHGVRIYEPTEEMVDDGEEVLAHALRRIIRYRETGDQWAGWSSEPTVIGW